MFSDNNIFKSRNFILNSNFSNSSTNKLKTDQKLTEEELTKNNIKIIDKSEKKNDLNKKQNSNIIKTILKKNINFMNFQRKQKKASTLISNKFNKNSKFIMKNSKSLSSIKLPNLKINNFSNNNSKIKSKNKLNQSFYSIKTARTYKNYNINKLFSNFSKQVKISKELLNNKLQSKLSKINKK